MDPDIDALLADTKYVENGVVRALRESGTFPLDGKFAYEIADQNGLVVVLPKPNELQLDIDNKASEETFARVRPVLESRFGILNIKY